MIFEGAGQTARSQLVQAKDRLALSLFSCLVQRGGCNREGKKRRRPKAESTASEGNHKKEEKNLLRRYFVRTFRTCPSLLLPISASLS